MNPFRAVEGVPSRRQVALSFLLLWGAVIGTVIMLSVCNLVALSVADSMKNPSNPGAPTSGQGSQGGQLGGGFEMPGAPASTSASAGAPAAGGVAPITLPTLPPPPTIAPPATWTPEPTLPPPTSTPPPPTLTLPPEPSPAPSTPAVSLADARQMPAGFFRAVSASGVDGPGRDGCGNPTSYEPALLIDGDPATTWRTQGDGVGEWVRLDFAAPLIVTEVQILSGYAKLDPCAQNVDRWPQGYRASVIDLVFSDGTSERRELADQRDLQPLPLAPAIRAEWLEVRIVAARPPSQDGAPRAYAAISELQVVGVQP